MDAGKISFMEYSPPEYVDCRGEPCMEFRFNNKYVATPGFGPLG
jgi:hypothetical protein